jgi:probable rRNA maturation factor
MPAVELPDNLDPSLETLLLRAAATTLLQQGQPADTALSIVIGNDAQLHQLNRQFSGQDKPTDVLSFPSGELDPDTQSIYLGDIVISYERARAQAEAGGHPVEDELQLLVVHGILHLLGHDHAGMQEKESMWTAQSAALRQLGINLSPP